MITLLRWYILKSKEIKIKLAFYSLLEGEMDKLINHKEELEQKFIHELAGIIHQTSNINE